MNDSQTSLQDCYAPRNICFGCGAANPQGLGLKTFAEGERLVARFRASPHHQAYAGMLNGGIIGTLLDCSGAWTAAWNLMQRDSLETPPCVVTAEYRIAMKLPTPATDELLIVSWPLRIGNRSVEVAGEISCNGTVTATCNGTFVAVKEGHPAWHRW